MRNFPNDVDATATREYVHPMDLITTAQAAEILGKSQRTVQRMIEAGVLVPGLVLASGFLLNRADVERVASEGVAA